MEHRSRPTRRSNIVPVKRWSASEFDTFPIKAIDSWPAASKAPNLYDRALTDEQVADSFAYWSDQITDQRVMKALTTGERERANRLRMETENLRQRIDSLGPVRAEASDRQAWTELVRTMFMLKEFIYVR